MSEKVGKAYQFNGGDILNNRKNVKLNDYYEILNKKYYEAKKQFRQYIQSRDYRDINDLTKEKLSNNILFAERAIKRFIKKYPEYGV